MVARSLRDAWRSLRSRPVVSAAAILSLALGMGGVTALFSLVNAAVLRPLPVRDPHELVSVATDRADSFPASVWAEIRAALRRAIRANPSVALRTE